MKKNSLLPVAVCTLFCLIWSDGLTQARMRRMSTVINHPSLNVFAPYISADANAIVFLSDNGDDNALLPFFSFRENADWKEPQELPKNVHTRLNFLRGYALTADGGSLLFSTTKSPGVGGYDIWISEWRGAWANPTNLGAPVNSRGHEACPSLTPDGKSLYFMRCEKMDQFRADQCKLFRVDRKSNGMWGEPEELPESINTGNSQSPRIMADGETLIFSSDKMAASKGGMDLYVTRFRDGSWSAPVAMDFVNTPKDDQYVTATGLGRYLIRDTPGARKNEIIEYLIPDALRPKGVMKIDGRVADALGKPVQAYVSLLDLQSGQRLYNGRPNSDGSFLLYAKEGSRYELAIDPEFGGQTYFSKTFDLTGEQIPQVEKVSAVLKAPAPGDEWELGGIQFDEGSGELDLTASQRELRRFARVASGNPEKTFEVQVLFEGYREDSVQSHPDLTEVAIDTVHWKYVDIDTLGQLYERDTASLRVTYHNDRTVRQAQSLIDSLVAAGAKEGNVGGYAEAAPAALPETRRTVVKAVVRK